MSKDPVLRQGKFDTRIVKALGGLRYIRGNRKPYFSLTIASWIGGREDTFGCAHEELVALWPELKPLADLHLSDIDGVPMHAEANGWYHMQGACPQLQGIEDYHLGNSKGHFGGEYREPTPDECLDVFCRHARINIEDGRALRDRLIEAYNDVPQYTRVYLGGGAKVARGIFGLWINAQKPRWAQEALQCIADLGLVVYGDAWNPEKVAA